MMPVAPQLNNDASVGHSEDKKQGAGILIRTIKQGDGPLPQKGDVCLVSVKK